MAKVRIEKKRCKGCGLCLIFCPKKNIVLDEKSNEAGIYPAIVIKEDACTGCGMCCVMCPEGCIAIEI